MCRMDEHGLCLGGHTLVRSLCALECWYACVHAGSVRIKTKDQPCGHVGQDRRLPGSLAFMRSATRPEGLYSDSGLGSKEWAPRLPGKLCSE